MRSRSPNSISPWRRTNDEIVVDGAHARGDLGGGPDSLLLPCRLHDPPQLDGPILHDYVDQRRFGPWLGIELCKHSVSDLRIADLSHDFNLLARTGQSLQQVCPADDTDQLAFFYNWNPLDPILLEKARDFG